MATYTFLGTNGNWNDSTKWTPTGIPGSGDDVIFDANSANCTIIAVASCKSIDFTNYGSVNPAIITFNANLTVYGNVTLGASMVFSGSSAMQLSASGTLTSNGKTCDVDLILKPISNPTTLTFTLAEMH
jgi:hypothetical protein